MLNPNSEVETGSARAARAVFRALAENAERAEKFQTFGRRSWGQTAGREARPATPEAGVLPNFGFRVESECGQRLLRVRWVPPDSFAEISGDDARGVVAAQSGNVASGVR